MESLTRRVGSVTTDSLPGQLPSYSHSPPSSLIGGIREGVKKKCEKAVRLTAWVDTPLPRRGQENVKNFDLDFRLLIFDYI